MQWKNPGVSCSTIFSKTWSHHPRNLLITIKPHIVARGIHDECFKIEKRINMQVNKLPNEEICECCQIPTSAIQTSSFNTRKSCVSTIVQMEKFFNTRFRDWILSQSRLVQYILISQNGEVFYMDIFNLNRQSHVKIFKSSISAYAYAKTRFQTKGCKFKEKLLLDIKQRLEQFSKYQSGTFNHWKTRIEKIEKEMIIFLHHWEGDQMDFEKETTNMQNTWPNFSLVGNQIMGKRHGFVARDARLFLSHKCIGSKVDSMHEFYEKVSEYFKFMDYYLETDVVSGKTISQTTITFEAILNKVAKDPLFIGIETPSYGLVNLLKRYNMHQILFSRLPFGESGERMSPDKDTIRGFFEMDLSMAYSHNLALSNMPMGMPLIYLPSKTKEGELNRVGNVPFKYGEFNLVYYIISEWKKRRDIELTTVYHRYSPNGSFYVEKYSLDLLIVYQENGNPEVRYKAYQFHHAFTHTCPRCEIGRYSKGLTREKLRKQSEDIDHFWQTFCHEHLNVQLEIIYHCHAMNVMGRFFQNIQEVVTHSDFLSDVTTFPLGHTLQISELLTHLTDPTLCIYIIGDGIQTAGRGEGRICTKTKLGETVLSKETKTPTMFYGPYLEFLIKEVGFELTSIYHVFVYKSTDKYMPLFKQLVNMRTNNAGNYFAEQLKLGCNSFVGLSGSTRSSNTKFKYFSGKLTKLSKNGSYNFYSPNCYSFTSNNSVYPRTNLYILNLTVLQLYRLKMVKTLELMEKIFKPNLFRVIHCHVDSFFVLLGKKSLPECIASKDLYDRYWKGEIFDDKKVPGKFHEVQKSSGSFFRFFIPGVTEIIIDEVGGIGCADKEILPKEERRSFIRKMQNPKSKFIHWYDDDLPYCTSV